MTITLEFSEARVTDLKLVIFDCDGTLADSLATIEQGMVAAFRELSLNPPGRPAIQQTIGLSLHQAMAELLPTEYVSDAALIDRLVATYRTHSFAIRKAMTLETDPLFDGAKAALSALSARGYLLAIATGKSLRGTHALVQGHQLDGLFQSIQTADGNPGKPSPVMVEKALNDCGAAAQHAVVIGDTVFDMQMARNAGVAGIGVSWGYHPTPALQDAGAGDIATSFTDLPGLIAATVGEPE